jgi:hypothetical protein
LCDPEPVVCLQLPTSVHCRSHIPEPHVWSKEAEAAPVAMHDPLPHVCEHEESSAHSSEQAPDPQTRLQIDPLSHVAAQVSLPEHVNLQLDPAVHKQSWVAEHVSLVVLIAASMPPSPLEALVPLLPHASAAPETTVAIQKRKLFIRSSS